MTIYRCEACGLCGICGYYRHAGRILCGACYYERAAAQAELDAMDNQTKEGQ